MVEDMKRAEANGKAWLESIAEMVRALGADFERRDELRSLLKETETDPDARMDEDDRAELDELEAACKIDGREMKDADAVRERIQESPLSVQVRGGWHDPGADDDGPEEYCVLLSTGGPALRIIGDLDGVGYAETATMQCQDWCTPWRDVDTSEYGAALLAFVQEFYFGE